jgi:hypothetical protein
MEADDEDEAKVVNMRNAWLSRPWREKYKKMVKTLPEEYWQVKEWKMRYTEHNLWE